MEVRRSGPLAVVLTLGDTADLALSADLEGVGGGREGDEDETRLGGWCGALMAVVAIVYGMSWCRSGQPDPQLRDDPASKEMGKSDVLDHVQNSGSNCVMTTIVDPFSDLHSSSLFAVRILDSPWLHLAHLSLAIGLCTGRKLSLFSSTPPSFC